MSNYNRAYTPKNIVNSAFENDIIELIDTDNDVWYAKINGHEYLVNLGQIKLNADNNYKIGTDTQTLSGNTPFLDNSLTYKYDLDSPIFIPSNLRSSTSKIPFTGYQSNDTTEAPYRLTGSGSINAFDYRLPFDLYTGLREFNSECLKCVINYTDSAINDMNSFLHCKYVSRSANNRGLTWGLGNHEVYHKLIMNMKFRAALIKKLINTEDSVKLKLVFGFQLPFIMLERSYSAEGTATPNSDRFAPLKLIFMIKSAGYADDTDTRTAVEFPYSRVGSGSVVDLESMLESNSYSLLTSTPPLNDLNIYGFISATKVMNRVYSDLVIPEAKFNDTYAYGANQFSHKLLPLYTLPVATLR